MKLTVNSAAALSCVATVPLFIYSPTLAAIPAVTFLLLLLTAPFFPQWSFFLPVISKSITGSTGVALTFDDGPSPDSTPLILDLLQKYGLPATFFVVGEKVAAHPQLIAEILSQGHTIGNHSWCHDNLLMLRSRSHLQQDIHRTQEILQQSGVTPMVFRPPAGITNPRLKHALKVERLTAVTFSCRAFDGGNKKVDHLARRILSRLRDGDIILLHDLLPQDVTTRETWQRELNSLLASLAEEAGRICPLEDLTGQPVMAFKKE